MGGCSSALLKVAAFFNYATRLILFLNSRLCKTSATRMNLAHALSCAAGYNIRWLLRAIARLGR